MSTGTPSEINDLLKNKRDDILRLATLVDGLENCAWGGGRLQMEQQNLLGRPVDLVGVEDLHRLIRDQVLREAIPL